MPVSIYLRNFGSQKTNKDEKYSFQNIGSTVFLHPAAIVEDSQCATRILRTSDTSMASCRMDYGWCNGCCLLRCIPLPSHNSGSAPRHHRKDSPHRCSARRRLCRLLRRIRRRHFTAAHIGDNERQPHRHLRSAGTDSLLRPAGGCALQRWQVLCTWSA